LRKLYLLLAKPCRRKAETVPAMAVFCHIAAELN